MRRDDSELFQWFQEEYVKCLVMNKSDPEKVVQMSCYEACSYRWKITNPCCDIPLQFVVRALLEYYMLATIFKLMWDDVMMIFTQCYPLFYKCWNLKDQDDDIEAQMSLLQKQILKEYIFVSFNAWLFNKTDELWVALIRELYRVVELRLSKMPPNKSSMCSSRWNYKFKWRVEKAIALLIESYGGEDKLRFQLYFPILVVLLGLLLALVLKTVGAVQLLNDILTKLGLMWKIILASLGAIPSLKVLYDANKNAATSRGDALFAEASGSIKDNV
jgi:hypothetical protein